MDLKCLDICVFLPNTRKKSTFKKQMCSLQVLNQKHCSEIRLNNFFSYLVVQRGHVVHTVSLNIHDVCFFLKERHCMPTKINWQNYFFYYILQLIILESRQNYHLNSIIVSILRDNSLLDFSMNDTLV